MENIKNLVTDAHNAVDEFEKYMFTNHLNIYIPAKECTEYMKARIPSPSSPLSYFIIPHPLFLRLDFSV